MGLAWPLFVTVATLGSLFTFPHSPRAQLIANLNPTRIDSYQRFTRAGRGIAASRLDVVGVE